MILNAHVIAIAFWLGVVGAEFVIERSRTAGKAHGYEVARIHYRIDLFLEIPALMAILITGFVLLSHVAMSTLLIVKVAAGLAVIGANLVCTVPVVLRKRAAERDDLAAVMRYSRAIDLTAVVGAPAALVALIIGAFLLRA